MKTFITIKKTFLFIVVGVIVCAAFCFLTCTDIEDGYGHSFAPITHTLTTNVTPNEGGRIVRVPNKTKYEYGDTVLLTAIPEDGYVFVRWSGATTFTNYQINLVMYYDFEVTAIFEEVAHGSLTDSRDGKTYNTITIGGVEWMAENLNYETENGSWCFADDEFNCDIYGRLYDWATAMNISSDCNTATTSDCGATVSRPYQGVCPSGWHLPMIMEWSDLFMWFETNGFDRNELGFSIQGGGGRWGDHFSGIGSDFWWSTAELNATNAHYYSSSLSNISKTNGFSVRCIKD